MPLSCDALSASVPFLLPDAPRVLTIPGLDGSGEDHWQSAWEAVDPAIRRVDLVDHHRVDRNRWVNRLNLAIERANGPVVLVAHGAGCLTLAWWAHYTQPAWADPVVGALLVAPPQVDSQPHDRRLAAFAPLPLDPLPFASILVASHNDPWCSFAHSERLAAFWGSDLHDAGAAHHISSDAAGWPEGRALLARLRHGATAAIGERSTLIEPSPLSIFA